MSKIKVYQFYNDKFRATEAQFRALTEFAISLYPTDSRYPMPGTEEFWAQFQFDAPKELSAWAWQSHPDNPVGGLSKGHWKALAQFALEVEGDVEMAFRRVWCGVSQPPGFYQAIANKSAALGIAASQIDPDYWHERGLDAADNCLPKRWPKPQVNVRREVSPGKFTKVANDNYATHMAKYEATKHF